MRSLLARFDLWLRSLLLVAVVASIGCAGTPATRARNGASGADVINAIVARAGKLATVTCANKARDKAKAGDAAGAQIDLDKCQRVHVGLDKGLRISLDTADATYAAIDAGEAIDAKDYSAALEPLKAAIKALLQLAIDAGIKLPPEALAAAKGLL